MARATIYTSAWLSRDPQTKPVADALHAALNKCGMQHRELMNTKDIWCRDFMPISLSDHREQYIGYTYNPDYLRLKPKNRPYITSQEEACEELHVSFAKRTTLVLDGGNIIRANKKGVRKVIMTDKIFMENPSWKTIDLINEVERTFEAELILLPWDMSDVCGHADGMVSYMGEGHMLLNSYSQLLKPSEQAFHRRLVTILQQHYELHEIHFDCKVTRDCWAYLNHLIVPGAILLPCLSPNCDCEQDRAAIRFFKDNFVFLNIIPVYALPLIRRGGALHCVTWEHFPSQRVVTLAQNL